MGSGSIKNQPGSETLVGTPGYSGADQINPKSYGRLYIEDKMVGIPRDSSADPMDIISQLDYIFKIKC